jgi:uncharacterized protein Veg
MEEHIQRLLNCIENEIEIYEKVLGLSERQKDALINNGEEKLQPIAEIQNGLIEEIKEQEDIRKKVCKEIAVKKNLALDKNIFKKVSGIIEEEYGSMFTSKIESMKMLMHRISEINNNNVFLIEQGKNNIRAFYSLVLNASDARLYSNNGKLGSKNSNIMLLDKRL